MNGIVTDPNDVKVAHVDILSVRDAHDPDTLTDIPVGSEPRVNEFTFSLNESV